MKESKEISMAKKPNILILWGDDIGWWNVSYNSRGQMGYRPPNIDRIPNEGGAFPKLLLPFKLFAGGPLGSGKQWLPWIHIADQIAAIQFLLHNEAADGPFNLSAPTPVTNSEMAKAIGEVMGRPAIVPAPAFAMRTALGEMATLVLDGQRAVPSKLQALGFQFKYETVLPALRDLLGKPANGVIEDEKAAAPPVKVNA